METNSESSMEQIPEVIEGIRRNHGKMVEGF